MLTQKVRVLTSFLKRLLTFLVVFCFCEKCSCCYVIPPPPNYLATLNARHFNFSFEEYKYIWHICKIQFCQSVRSMWQPFTELKIIYFAVQKAFLEVPFQQVSNWVDVTCLRTDSLWLGQELHLNDPTIWVGTERPT